MLGEELCARSKSLYQNSPQHDGCRRGAGNAEGECRNQRATYNGIVGRLSCQDPFDPSLSEFLRMLVHPSDLIVGHYSGNITSGPGQDADKGPYEGGKYSLKTGKPFSDRPCHFTMERAGNDYLLSFQRPFLSQFKNPGNAVEPDEANDNGDSSGQLREPEGKTRLSSQGRDAHGSHQ